MMLFEDSVLIIPFSEFLANDVPGPTNESHQSLTIIAVGGAVGGTVTIEGTNVVAVLSTNFNGEGRFIYVVQDNGTTDGQPDFRTATATIVNNVIPVNDPPAGQSASFAVDEDGAVAITLRGDDGDPEASQVLTFAITLQPQHGTLSGFNPATGALTYTPAPDYLGEDSFQFTVTDDNTAGATNNLTSAAAPSTSRSVPRRMYQRSLPRPHEGKQMGPGLVITRHPADGPEVTHFKISQIENGTLYQNDGVTVIAGGAFITVAQGMAGLKFTPTAGLYSAQAEFGFEV